MSALRDRDVLDGRPGEDTIRPTLRQLADRAVAPAGTQLLANLTRAALVHEAVVVGSGRRAEGGDVIALTTDFLAVRAELRKRRPRPAGAPAGTRSSVRERQVESLLDDVLVALVRGYEESPELGSSPDSNRPMPRPNRAPPPIAMDPGRGSDS